MKFSRTTGGAKRAAAQLLIVPYFEGKAAPKAEAGDWTAFAKEPIALGDFQGKEGQLVTVYAEKLKERRLLLVGLGKPSELTMDSLRTAFAKATLRSHRLKAERANVVLPASGAPLSDEAVVAAIAEGMNQANYRFDALKAHKLKEQETVLLKGAALVGATAKQLSVAEGAASVGAGATLARDLINGNADDVTPQHLAKVAKQIAGRYDKVSVTVFDRARIEREGMGLLLAVNRGSAHDPAFIILKYRGKPSAKEHTVLVGKGITFDSGGLNIKPTGSMEDMKTDMSAAAACLGTLEAVARLGMPVNCTVVVASTENMVDAKSYKPGDVYTAITGKTVEIVNTDAEGRLTLADALGYAEKHLKPTRMINLATLTGSAVIALGEEMAALMSNDDKLVDDLQAASERSGELLWRMPLYAGYRKHLKSDIADLKNCGPRWGGALTAGLFLQEFVERTPWAHLDIAGVAYPNKVQAGHSGLATGYGVRLLVELLSGGKR